jgi:hypothetical protein
MEEHVQIARTIYRAYIVIDTITICDSPPYYTTKIAKTNPLTFIHCINDEKGNVVCARFPMRDAVEEVGQHVMRQTLAAHFLLCSNLTKHTVVVVVDVDFCESHVRDDRLDGFNTG